MTLAWVHHHFGKICKPTTHDGTCDNLEDEIGCFKITTGNFKGQCVCVHSTRVSTSRTPTRDINKRATARRASVRRAGVKRAARRAIRRRAR